ncbi:TonB-dependent receptor plug domain-containing protein [Planctomycetota bacterium]
MKARAYLLCLTLSIAPVTAAFSRDDLSSEERFFQLEELIVTTASKFAQKESEAPAIVKVWEREFIEAIGAKTVSDVLRTCAGIYIPISSETRELAWIRGVNGADNSRVLVLIDGFPFKDVFYAHGYIDEYVPISHVKRIEFIKGPGSALYGANAFSGVINIITEDGKSFDKKRIAVAAGSFYEKRIELVAGGATETPLGELDFIGFVKVFDTEGSGGKKKANPNIANPNQSRPLRSLAGGLKLRLGDLTLRGDMFTFETRRIDGKYDENNVSNILIQDATAYRYFYQSLSLHLDHDLSDELNVQAKAYSQHYNHTALYGDLNFRWNESAVEVFDEGKPVGSIPAQTFLEWESAFNAYFTIPTKRTYRFGAEIQGTWTAIDSELVRNVAVGG